MKISRRCLADYVKTLHQKACCTCRFSSFNQLFHLFVVLSLMLPSSNLKLPKGPGKRGHILADTLLLMMFLGRAYVRDTKWMLCFHAAQTEKHLLRTQNVSEQNQKHFLCPGHKICRQQMLCAKSNGETFMSAAMCPRLPGPLSCPQNHKYGNFTLLFCRGWHGGCVKMRAARAARTARTLTEFSFYNTEALLAKNGNYQPGKSRNSWAKSTRSVQKPLQISVWVSSSAKLVKYDILSCGGLK